MSFVHTKQVFVGRIEAVSLRFATGDADLADLLERIEAAADQFVRMVEAQSREAPISKSFARACRLADAEARSQCRRHELEPIPIVATHGVPSAERLQAEYERTIQRHHERYGPAKLTLEAAEFLVREDDPARLRAWLDQHSSHEVLAITKHIRTYRKKRRGQQCPTTK